MDRAEIVKKMEVYAESAGLNLSTVGQYALRDRHIYDRLKRGGAVHDRTLKALNDWLSERAV